MGERRIPRQARHLWNATANPEGPGLLLKGREYHPVLRQDLDALTLDAMIRLARLAASVADTLREHPDAVVRRSAAVLAARGYPIRAAFDA